jgi:hypothetical protein
MTPFTTLRPCSACRKPQPPSTMSRGSHPLCAKCSKAKLDRQWLELQASQLGLALLVGTSI